ncbi:MAG: TIR domain-containing protein [Defluviitaleaceae bacterium]|nr:TIR domain-containing protein [Defluviitaleaceae bacterium]
MPHDVFISYSSKNKTTADAVCHALEKSGIRCWIAPRDISAGYTYGGQIMYGVENCKVFLLLFSDGANRSEHVLREIERAVNYKKTIIQFRIENVPMCKDFEYFLGAVHWIDAYPPNDTVFDQLITAISGILGITVPVESAVPEVIDISHQNENDTSGDAVAADSIPHTDNINTDIDTAHSISTNEPTQPPSTEEPAPPPVMAEHVTQQEPDIEPYVPLKVKRKRKAIRESLAKYNMYNGCLSVGGSHIVGLKTDGTVVATGDNAFGQCDVSHWCDIVAVYAGATHTVGLKSNQTIVTTKKWNPDEIKWGGITAIAVRGNPAIWLKSDGTVVDTRENENARYNVSDWRDIVAISAGANHIVGLKADGTVVATGENTHNECKVSHWHDIVAVAAGIGLTVGLKSDGTVEAAGYSHDFKDIQDNIADLHDIVAVAIGGGCDVAALKEDGSVVTINFDKVTLHKSNGQNDIVAITAEGDMLLGLKSDGTIEIIAGKYPHEGCYISDWHDIGPPSHKTPNIITNKTSPQDEHVTKPPVQSLDKKELKKIRESLAKYNKYNGCLSISHSHIVGLKTDGTVLNTGSSTYGQCSATDWRDIIAVSAGYAYTVGLKANGTVTSTHPVSRNRPSMKTTLETWEDIVAVENAGSYIIGLKSDGTVISVGCDSHARNSISKWRNIVAISASPTHIVGLKADGTVVATGKNTNGECYVAQWSDIVSIASTCRHTFGLRPDGTVMSTTVRRGESHISNLHDIVAIATSDRKLRSNIIAGLWADGTVVITDQYGYSGRTEYKSTTGKIVAITAGHNMLLGLKSDGTVEIITGKHPNSECDISNWRNIGPPRNMKKFLKKLNPWS